MQNAELFITLREDLLIGLDWMNGFYGHEEQVCHTVGFTVHL